MTDATRPKISFCHFWFDCFWLFLKNYINGTLPLSMAAAGTSDVHTHFSSVIFGQEEKAIITFSEILLN